MCAVNRYECHCAARYGGNNCQVDKGSPCSPNPCRHTGRCVEDVRGDYTCLCPNNYHGTHCELEVSLDPQCVARPCLNNGSCSVPDPAAPYVCDCPPGEYLYDVACYCITWCINEYVYRVHGTQLRD